MIARIYKFHVQQVFLLQFMESAVTDCPRQRANPTHVAHLVKPLVAINVFPNFFLCHTQFVQFVKFVVPLIGFLQFVSQFVKVRVLHQRVAEILQRLAVVLVAHFAQHLYRSVCHG